MTKLRKYQSDLLGRAHQARAQGRHRPLLDLPTGGGKGTIAAEEVREAAAQGKRVVVCCHRLEILKQLNDRIVPLGIRPSFIAQGMPADPSNPVQLAMIPTLHRRVQGGLPPADLLILDEAHHSVARTWREVIAAYGDTDITGYSATPFPTGGGLDEVFDAHLRGPDARWLTDNGFLTPGAYYAPSVPDLAGLRTVRGDWSTEDLEKAMQRSRRFGSAVKSYSTILWPGATAVMFCVSVAHAQEEVDALNAAGIRARILTGDTKGPERDALFAALAARELDIVATVDVVSEGVDIPSIDAVFLMRPTQSMVVARQQIGRALRVSPGKDLAYIIDHGGVIARHGRAIDPVAYTLAGLDHTDRDKRETSDGELISISTCSGCLRVYETAPCCPYCGCVVQTKQRVSRHQEAEIKRLTDEEAERMAEARAIARRKEEAGEKTLADWLKIAKDRGYKPGWAHQRHKLRQAKSPRKKPLVGLDDDGWPLDG